MTFDSFSFDRRIQAGIRACNYETPTPIQNRAIPAVLEGKDVLGLAQTGTGKTAAFALPLLQNLIDARANTRGPVKVLVLAPTRELALQIHESFVDLGRQTGIRSVAVFGGVGINPQIKALRQATVVVACPGRLLDLINRRAVNLSQVRHLVIDEADRMFDMGFMPDLRKIMSYLPEERQNLLFSATMPPEIRKLSSGVLQEPVVVQVANTAPPEAVQHALYPVPASQKPDLLQALLENTEHDCVLVFTRTKHRAKSLARKLCGQGWRATSLQGNLSQNRRQEALDGFRRGKYRIMVATDIAARGIDCARVSHVINFDVPDTAENYTHRIGRTGRAERSGTAMTLITDEDRYQIKSIERILGKPIERIRLDGFEYKESRGLAPRGDQRPRANNHGASGRQDRPGGRGNQGRKPGGYKAGNNRPKRRSGPRPQAAQA